MCGKNDKMIVDHGKNTYSRVKERQWVSTKYVGLFVRACRGKSDRKGTTTAARAHTIICSSSVQDSMAPQHLTI